MKHLLITLLITVIFTAGFALKASTLSVIDHAVLKNLLFSLSAIIFFTGCGISAYWMVKFQIN